MNRRFKWILITLVLAGLFLSSFGAAEEAGTTSTHVQDSHGSEHAEDGEEHGHGAFAKIFLYIAVILLAAKLASLIEKWGQPAVLGELVIGVVLGNLALIGINFFTPIATNEIILFLSELGVVILLFQIGLESNIHEMKKVGLKAMLVAITGVVVPFLTGYLAGPYLLPGLSSNTYLFLGATLAATSVGITARVFKDLGKLNIPESKVVLGAAVIDDVLALVILAVVSAIVDPEIGTASPVMVLGILAKSLGFLIGAVILGQLLAPRLGKIFSKIHTGFGMKFTLAFGLCLTFAWGAQEIGLAAIVGAFAAGLILDAVHFKDFEDPHVVDDVTKCISSKMHSEADKKEIHHILHKHSHRHIEDLIEPVGMFLIPIFFIVTGFQVDLTTLTDMRVLGTALAMTAIAVVGKVVAGLPATKLNKWIIGWGMVPRGEVGLIFASIGKGLGVVNNEVFSIIVIMVILTTLMTPPILNVLLKKMDKKKGKENTGSEPEPKENNAPVQPAAQ